jgi:hypothetical protein
VADRFASPTDAVKAVVDLRTQMSQRIKPIGENADPEDVARFRKALGVPEKPEEYKVVPPEGTELSELDKALLEKTLPIAHKYNVPQEALNGFVAEFMQTGQQAQSDLIAQIEDFGKESETALKREWGGDYDRNLNIARRTAEVLGGPEFKSFLNETPLPGSGMLGDHPMMVKMLATLGRRTDEGDLMLGATPEETASVQQEIDELMSKVPPGTPAYLSPTHQQKLSRLYEQLAGRGGIVGSSGRSA